MLSSVGLEVMNSANPELSWKTVTKGRRSRKSVARSLNSVVKVGNSTSPKRVGDFSGSDSDKFGEVVHGQSTSGKSENVPLKKRRHLLQSPLPHPWASSLCRQDSASPRTRSLSPSSEYREQRQYPSCPSGRRSSNWHLRGIEGSAKVRGGEGFDDVFLCEQREGEYKDGGDFSGIELLAAAASMDDDADNADKKDVLLDDSSVPKNSDASSSATLSKVGLKNNESENSSSNMNMQVGNMDCSQENNSAAASERLCESPEDGTMPKVNRQHWDLNTLMDAWDEPYDDLFAGDTSKDVNADTHREGEQKSSGDHAHSSPGGTRDESSNLKIEENKLTSVSEDRICSETPSREECLQEPPKSILPIAAKESSDQAGEKDPDDNSIRVLNCDADVKNSSELTSSDAILDSSPFTKLCCSSGMLKSEEKTNSISGTVAITQEEDCSSNVSECERSTAPDETHTRTQDINAHDITASESALDVHLKDTEDSRETFELPGTFTQDAQPVVIADSNKQNDGTFVSGSTIPDCQGYLEPAEVDAKHEDDHAKEGLEWTILEGTGKSCSAGAQSDDPTTSIGRIGLSIVGRRGSDVSQDNHVNTADGDDLTGSQEGYDSPYEDGELRGSFLCSWEDNEMENECVDYESDGRNGDGSDAADCPASEIVEGGSEGSHGTQRSLSMKISLEGKSKSGQVKHSLRKHFVKDDSDNNEIAGRGSNAGSGTTVEQCMEMIVEENDDVRRRQLTDRRDAVNVKVTHTDEYVSRTVRGKLQSRIEGRSSADATDAKDAFFMQRFRPRRLGGSYSRPERDISPDRYMGRSAHGERDGAHQWTSWGSRRRYTSNYQGAEGRNFTRPRSKTGESAEEIDGVDFHDPRQTANYLSKGLHRPLMRRSPVERDDYFGVGRRIPPARGMSNNYRSRGHYSQRAAGRDFVEDFEPLPDDNGVSLRMPRYLSRRERSFSPSAGRIAHMTLPRRRSRSRSRSRSPRTWHTHSHRERILGTRRHSRSPEFRSEARMERMRLPFPKPTFASDYGEDYVSPSRSRFSPQRNCRWVDDRNFADNHHMRRRRSPVRVFRRTQRFDAVGSSGRLKSDEYFRPVVRPKRFSFMANGGRECKLESSYDDRRRDDSGEIMHRVLHSDDAGNVRRFRHNAADDFETNNLNNEDVVRVTDLRDVPQTQGEREDKRALKI